MKVNLPFNCNQCGKQLVATVDMDPLKLAPSIRGGSNPVGIRYEYHITSEDIKKFIIEKAHMYVPNAVLEITPRYCERKRRKGYETQKGYASYKIAFSHHVIKDYENNTWYHQLGESSENTLIVESLFKNLIEKWSYNKDYVNKWLKSYKDMERLEESFGMSDQFIEEIKAFRKPKGVKIEDSNDIWVFFMGCPESIIMDYFTNPETNKVPGKIEIAEVKMISKDIIGYTIFINPYSNVKIENPNVRQILAVEEKI